MMSAIPLVSEVNAMSEEMYRPQRFSLRLLANQDRAIETVKLGREDNFETLVREFWRDGGGGVCMYGGGGAQRSTFATPNKYDLLWLVAQRCA